jgi:hypothetical protein
VKWEIRIPGIDQKWIRYPPGSHSFVVLISTDNFSGHDTVKATDTQEEMDYFMSISMLMFKHHEHTHNNESGVNMDT